MKNTFLYIRIFLMALSLTLALVMMYAPSILITVTIFLLLSPLIFGSVTYAFIVYAIYDIVRPILYTWALVVTIQGKQDFVAIMFYVLTALQVINIIKRFIGTVCGLFVAFTE